VGTVTVAGVTVVVETTVLVLRTTSVMVTAPPVTVATGCVVYVSLRGSLKIVVTLNTVVRDAPEERDAVPMTVTQLGTDAVDSTVMVVVDVDWVGVDCAVMTGMAARAARTDGTIISPVLFFSQEIE